MASQAQVIDVIELDITFGVGVPVPPNTFANYVSWNDVSDYPSILNPGETIKTLIWVKTAIGTTVYKSAGYDLDDFTNPEYPDNNPSTQKQLPVLSGTSTPVEGVYQFLIKAKFDDGVSPFIVNKTINSADLCVTEAPAISLEETYDCDAGTYQSQDVTDYASNVYTLSTIVRDHTVYPPSVSGQSPTSGNAAIIEVGNLWSGVTYEADLTSTVTYTSGNTSIIFVVTGYAEKKVVCDSALCDLYCALTKIRERYFLYKGNNPRLEAEYNQKYTSGTREYFMAIQARLCGQESAVQTYVNKFYDVTGLDPDCDCCDENAPAPVIPVTNVINGEDGTDGLTPELRVSGTTLQWKYTSEDPSQWRNLIDFSLLNLTPDFEGYNYELAINEITQVDSSAAAKAAPELLYTTNIDLQSGLLALNGTGNKFKVTARFTFDDSFSGYLGAFTWLNIGGLVISWQTTDVYGIFAPTVEISMEFTRRASATSNSLYAEIKTTDNQIIPMNLNGTSIDFGSAVSISAFCQFDPASTALGTEIRLDQITVEKTKIIV